MSFDNPYAISRDAFNHRQMLHRLSTHSSNTSNSSKRTSARITKTTPLSSPHNVQRRRTNPTHTTRSFPRMTQDNPYAARDQRLRHYYSQYSMDMNRPMSWHPGSERLQTSFPPLPNHDPAIGNTIAGFENLAVTGTPQPSLERSIQDAFSMAYGFPMSQTPTDYLNPSTFPQNDPAVTAITNHLNQPFPAQYPSNDQPATAAYPFLTPDPAQDMYNVLSDYGLPHHTRSHPQTQYDYSSPLDQYQLPTETQWQEPMSVSHDTMTNAPPRLQKKKSKELVGLGLYDDEQEDFLSTLNSAPNRESLGKDLKLEETWQPPKDGEDAEEEIYSSDEVEEEEGPEAPVFIAQVPAEPSTFYPAYGDMSNQSFFFNEDDQQIGHEAPYVNYAAFDSEGQVKSQPVTGAGSFGWL